MEKLSSVVIIGRPNVGKSTLFNRLIGKKKSIVTSLAGTTRDRIYGKVEWQGKVFKLIDTGGYMLNSTNCIESLINNQVEKALQEANLIIFLCDGKQGLVPLDIEISKKIRKFNKTIFLCINKIDVPKNQYQLASDFYKLGFENTITISAEHSIGVDDLLEKIIHYIPEHNLNETERDKIKIAIIGKPNVGKSSIINALIGEERLIISEVPGTTRDSIDIHFKYNEFDYYFIDTAGIKKKSKTHNLPELISIIKAKKTIDNSDIVLLVLDCTREIQHIEAELAGYTYNKIKPLAFIINKIDLMKNKIKDQKAFINYMKKRLNFVSFAPFLFVSAKTKENIKYILNIINNLYESYVKRIKTSELNLLLQDELNDFTLGYVKNKPIKIQYITQVSIKPPTFVLFANKRIKPTNNQLKYLENLIRKRYYSITVPIKIIIKSKKKI